MKAERIKIAVKENADITVRDRGGKFGVYCVGPGWVEVEMKKKRRKTSRRSAFKTKFRRVQSDAHKKCTSKCT
jgi:hypothetical protein